MSTKKSPHEYSPEVVEIGLNIIAAGIVCAIYGPYFMDAYEVGNGVKGEDLILLQRKASLCGAVTLFWSTIGGGMLLYSGNFTEYRKKRTEDFRTTTHNLENKFYNSKVFKKFENNIGKHLYKPEIKVMVELEQDL